MKLLIIDDDQEVVSVVEDESLKLGIETLVFKPISREKIEIKEQLSELCKENSFDFALLDSELWSGLKGYELAETLSENKVRFVAFSSSYENNSVLLKSGAVSSIQKNYNSRGFDKQGVIKGLTELLT